MKKLNRKNLKLQSKPPIKVVQFGEGNFLRGFVNYAFQKLNKEVDFNAGVAVVQPIENGLIHLLNEQEGLYTLFMKGVSKKKIVQEKELITNIVQGINPYTQYEEYKQLAKEEALEFIISNTTEAGIIYNKEDSYDMQPPNSFPAKLTVLLYERYRHFNGASNKGLTIIPCELINYNSDTLRQIILAHIEDWELGIEFKNWLLNHSTFHNTLVDRIVPGYPIDQIEEYNQQTEYQDNLIVTAEIFMLWVIEGNATLKQKLPFDKTDLAVKIVKDMQPYRTRKVLILNGVHTAIFSLSYLNGNQTVKETMDDDFTLSYIESMVKDEIIPTMDGNKQELTAYANEVYDRYRNPFIKHKLASLGLNAISKFKVRVLPSLLEFERIHKKIPCHLTFSFACLIRFYKGEWKDNKLPLNDNEMVLDFLSSQWKNNNYLKITESVLRNKDFWGKDLTQISNLSSAIVFALEEIEKNGIKTGFLNFSKKC